MSPNQKNIMLLNIQNYPKLLGLSGSPIFAFLCLQLIQCAVPKSYFPFRQRSRFHWHAGPPWRKLTAVAAKKIRERP